MIIQIFGKDGSPKIQAACGRTCSHQNSLQGDNVLSLSFTCFECIEIDVNDYVDFGTDRFRAVEKYVPVQVSSVEWTYNIKFYAIQSLINRFLVMMLADGAYETEFSLTAPASEHLQLIVDCINEGLGTTDWKVGECVQTENLTLDYSGTYCDAALATLAEKANTEYWFDGNTVNLIRCEHGNTLPLACGRELMSMEKSTASNVKFFTRLFPIGSTRNIDPADYGASRLTLPDGRKYIDGDTEQYGIIHHYEKSAFTDIYPRRVGTVSSVRVSDGKSDDGKAFKIYWFKDESLDFDPSEYEIAGLVKHVVFQSGELDGRDFEVNWHSDDMEFEIITQWPYDDDRQLPGETLIPSEGDKYILWNIKMPKEYYAAAEQELLDAAEDFMEENRKDLSVYKAHTNYIEIDRQKITLSVGQRVMLENPDYFPDTGYIITRITSITRYLDCPSAMDIEMGDVVDKGTIDAINDSIRETRSYVAQSSAVLPGIVKSWEDTKLTDSNLMSSAKSVLEMARRSISKVYDDIVSGVITFLKRPVALIGMEFGKFQSGQAGAGGAVLIDENGNSKAEVDYLNVRKVAQFNRLVIQDTRHAGGRLILSPASMVCSRMEETDDAYRCYFETHDSDGHSVYNQFVVGDQAIRQSFNMNMSKYYWRLVTAVGDDWIDLSKTDCDTGSGIPEKGDEIVQLGNRADTSRQSAHILSSYGDGAPSYEVFNGINSYSLAEKDIAGIIYNPYQKQPQVYCFGEMYIGDRNPDEEGATFMTFQRKEGEAKPKAFFQGDVSIGAGSSGLTNLSEWAGKQDEINAAQQSANDAQSTANSALQKAQDAKDYIDNTLPDEIAKINRKLDGVVESWYYDYSPTLQNEPAATWIKDGTEKDHVGDTFTNTQEYVNDETTPDAGKSWRWVQEGTSYNWTPIADSDAVKALQQAAKAQDTADQKRRVFVTTPYTPYEIGDMWMQGPDGEIMRCIKARLSGTYDKIDWDNASKYTDDTAVNNLEIGGTNLARNSEFKDNSTDGWEGWQGNIQAENGVLTLSLRNNLAGIAVCPEISLIAGQKYIVSTDIRSDNVTSCAYNYIIRSDYDNQVIGGNLKVTTEWTRVYLAFVPEKSKSGGIGIGATSSHPDNATLQLRHFKVEVGDKATAWSPAPEDVDGEIQRIGNIATDAQNAADNAQSAANVANSAVNGIKNFTDTAFADGVVDRAEAVSIEKYKNTVNETLQSIQGTYNALYTNTELTGTAKSDLKTAYDNAVSAINTLLAKIDLAIKDGKTTKNEKSDVNTAYSTVITKIQEYNSAVEEANAAIQARLNTKATLLASATMGNMLYADPEFKKGINGISVYKLYNSSSSTPTLIRKAISGIPNSSGYGIEIVAPQGGGGFAFKTLTKANIMLVCRFVAKIPEGRQIMFATNGLGENSTRMWLTSDLGTGEWEEYAYYVRGGNAGTFSTTFHFYIKGTEAATWQLAYATVFDLSSASKLIEEVATAQEAADAAAERLDEWADDGKISPTEKPAIKDEIARIEADQEQIQTGYEKYGLGTPTSYISAYSTYRNQLVALSADSPENISIPDSFRDNQANYYNQRTKSLTAISNAAKDAVDNIVIAARNIVKNGEYNIVSKAEYWLTTAYLHKELVAGNTYTAILSGLARGTQQFALYNSISGTRQGYFTKVSERIHTLTFKYNAGSATNHKSVTIYNYPSSGSEANPADIDWVCIYEGDVKAPHTFIAAQEDLLQAAADAQSTANVAKESAETANSSLSGLMSDNMISPPEKTSLKQQLADIKAEYSQIISDAQKYSVSTTNYASAYSKANSALTKYTATSPQNITIGSDYSNISAYYTARQTILNSIATAAKKVATDAQSTADTALLSAQDATNMAIEALQNKKEFLIDATGFDESKYYPVTIMISANKRTFIEVTWSLNENFVPSWANHKNGYVCHAKWSAFGNGYGYTAVSRVVDVFQWSWTKDNASPIGSIGQLQKTSYEYIYVRGGGKYRFTTSGEEPLKSNPILRTTTFETSNGEALTAPISSAMPPSCPNGAWRS